MWNLIDEEEILMTSLALGHKADMGVFGLEKYLRLRERGEPIPERVKNQIKGGLEVIELLDEGMKLNPYYFNWHDEYKKRAYRAAQTIGYYEMLTEQQKAILWLEARDEIFKAQVEAMREGKGIWKERKKIR